MMIKMFLVDFYERQDYAESPFAEKDFIGGILHDTPEDAACCFDYYSDGEDTSYQKKDFEALAKEIEQLGDDEKLCRLDYIVSIQYLTQEERDNLREWDGF